MINLRERGVPLACSVSERERNWGGTEAMFRFMSGLVDDCVRFPEPHGWEAGTVVAAVIAALRRRGRRQ
jgi:hypothetical protein